MIREFIFSGEESARFTRFAMVVLEAGYKIKVIVDGREPLTSRPVHLAGFLINAKLDGYLRYIIISEEGSEIEYWIAGSNSTRSIATRQIIFQIEDNILSELRGFSKGMKRFIPRISTYDENFDPILRQIDAAPDKKGDRKILEFLLEQLSNSNEEMVTETALSLRSFATIITLDMSLQREAERYTIQALQTISNRDGRIALAEDLGYIGSEQSIPILSKILVDPNEHDYTRWAAAIALGRLPGKPIIDVLLQGLTISFDWTVAAILLGLSRRADETNQTTLEPRFAYYLSANIPPLLKRYACLGLSKFQHLSDNVFNSLRDIIGDPTTSPDVKGYASLAISSSLLHIPIDSHQQIALLLESVSKDIQKGATEPEHIWGLEYMAELATLLEENSTSAVLHNKLANEYHDWRVEYYHSMAHYDNADDAVRRNASDDAIEFYKLALQNLPSKDSLPHEVLETLTFRRDIIQSRLNMYLIIHSWNEAIEMDGIDSLSNQLRSVAQTYAKYSSQPSLTIGIKQLSDREILYIRNTKKLVDVMRLLMRLDGLSRMSTVSIDNLHNQINLVLENLQPLHEEFSNSLAKSLNNMVEEILRKILLIQAVLNYQEMSDPDKLRGIRALMSEIRTRFSMATWPMPARACPVSGLGKGTIRVLKEDLPGDGTEHSPFLFPQNTKPILNVIAEIIEMAPGGSTSAQVICTVVGQEKMLPVPVPEGPYRLTFDLPDVLSTLTSTQCEISLKFQARDCSQIASMITVYIRHSR